MMMEGPLSKGVYAPSMPPTIAGPKKTVLGDRFIIGEELGRGAYGQVYKTMDHTTGDTVAIKQISLSGMSQDNLQSVMGEIELLKTLNHKNIVQYIGSFKTRTHLYIILEYMENGALSGVIKPNKFGVFPETLVAVYIAQVLQGLQYLHEQGVVHRDIKGANILTTKELMLTTADQGLVKLADFGVAAKLGELEEINKDELKQNVVGTPYWMAPEVIEMTQVTSASDIWSVGCLIIELLTGNPPYHDLQPMSALFRIVQDPHPLLPESLSPLMEDFLLRCFQKDPKMRPTAKSLLQHEWLKYNRRTLKSSYRKSQGFRTTANRTNEAHESVDSVVQRILAADDMEDSGGGGVGPAVTAAEHFTSAAAATAGSVLTGSGRLPPLASAAARPCTEPPLPGAPPPVFPPVGSAAVALGPPEAGLRGADSMVSGVATAAGSPAPYPPPGGPPWSRSCLEDEVTEVTYGGGTQAASPASATQLLTRHEGGVDGSLSAARLAGPPEAPLGDFISRLQGDTGVGVPSTSARVAGGHDLEAWLAEGDANALGGTLGRGLGSRDMQYERRTRGESGQYNLFSMVQGHEQPGRRSNAGTMGVEGAMEENYAQNSHVLDLKKRVRQLVVQLRPPPLHSMLQGPAQAFGGLQRELAAHPDARQYFMAESGVLVILELLDSNNAKHIEVAIDLVMLLTAEDFRLLESLCLVGIVPAITCFTQQPWPLDLRLKAAAFVQRLCFARDSTLQMLFACQGLKLLVSMVADLMPSPHGVSLLGPAPAELKAAVGPSLTHCALACIWQLVEAYGALPINYTCRLLAQNGLVPRLFIVIKQAVAQQQAGRPAAARLAPPPTPPSYGTPGGLVAMFTSTVPTMPRFMSNQQQVPAAVATAAAAGAAAAPSNRQRVSSATQAGLPSASPAAQMAAPATPYPARSSHQKRPSRPFQFGTDGDPLDWLLERSTTLLLVLSLADVAVKDFMCTRDNLRAHLECLQSRLPNPQLVDLMTCLRYLTSEHTVLQRIKEANTIPVLVPFLSKEREDLGVQVQLEALHVLYNLCRFKTQQDTTSNLEAAANAGVIAHLCRLTTEHASHLSVAAGSGTNQPAKGSHWCSFRGFVVPILISMVATSSGTRAKLWASNGMDILLQLLAEQDTVNQIGILQALDRWLAEDHTRVEQKLTQKESIAQLVQLYARSCQAQDAQAMPQLLDSLRQMIGRSSKLAVAVAVGGLVPWLLLMIEGAAPILQIKILDIVRCLYEHYPRPKEFIMVYKISDVLKKLLETHGRGSDAVVEQAQRLLNAFQINVLL